MGDAGGTMSVRGKFKGKVGEDDDSEEEVWNSEDEDETIARIQRAHFAQAAAMNPRRRVNSRPRPMSHKRKMEAVKTFHDFTKKLKKDTGITIRSLIGQNVLDVSGFSSEDNSTDSDGLSEEEFVVDPSAAQESNDENDSYIDPETGDIVEAKKTKQLVADVPESALCKEKLHKKDEEPKTLTISDIINEGDLDLTKNVEIAEVEQEELCSEKTAEELLNMTKQEDGGQDFDVTDKLKEMEEISEKPSEQEGDKDQSEEKQADTDEEKKALNPNALNVRRNIREVMDEKNLDASTLAAQRQESERLARVQEQQRIIREVQRQIALNRQNKIHQKTLSLLQGGSSLLKKGGAGQKLNLPNTVLVKLPSGDVKKTPVKQHQLEVTKVSKPTTSGASMLQKQIKPDQKSEKKEVVEIVDSSSGEESSSSSSDSDDCIMLSDSEVPPSPEAEEDPGNSGLHVNDAYNVPDEQGRVLINIGHAENEEDIFLAPQIARVIKPHQIGGVRFLFDNIIESVQRFSTSTGFGCILAHSMGLGKTLQIVCFCDIFLRHTNSKTVLCIMPINTLQNWVAEFNMWLPLDATNSPLAAHGEVRPRNFPIYVLNDSHKTLQMRAKVVKEWSTVGGVLMIGYELYRLLSMKKDKKPRKKKKADKNEADKEKEDKKNEKLDDDSQGTHSNLSKPDDIKAERDDGDSLGKADTEIKDDKKEDTPTDEDKKLLDEMYEALVKPGPDLVICDEGHRIKNSHSNISYALKQMRTKRRVVLTGYPLQNNLLEYWCMVDFVRPNYLGSKTEFCNMFERPIQNGQCIDSTPQDIRLMRYRAHVLHSLLVGFVQRRSHAVLQSTLPQKEEYVLLVRMTPLQRKLYDRFMNEVVRSASVPNPLKAFAICCKIWNHPDVLYNFLKKRNEVNAAIEEDLDLEEIGGVTKAGRAKNNKASTRRTAKPRGSSKKPAATIPPNTTAPTQLRQDPTFRETPFPPNGPYGSNTFPNPPPPDRTPSNSSTFPQYPPYQNSNTGYFPPNPTYNSEYGNNYYPQQQPYSSNYPNQYPPSNSEQGYNQNFWGNSNYYGNQGYYGNQQYGSNQPSAEFNGNQPSNYNSQQYPANYNPSSSNTPYPGNSLPSYSNNQEGYGNQNRPPYQGTFSNTPDYPQYNAQNPPSEYRNNPPSQEFPNQPYPQTFTGNSGYEGNPPATYNQFANQPPNYPNYANNIPPQQSQGNVIANQPQGSNASNQTIVKSECSMDPNYRPSDVKSEVNDSQSSAPANYGNPYGYPQQHPPRYPETVNANSNYNYPNFPPQLETKPPLCSASSGSPVTSWPLTEPLKTELDKIKAEDKMEMKSESDGEVKIEDLDTKKIVKDEAKKEFNMLPTIPKNTPTQSFNNSEKASNADSVTSVALEKDNDAKKGRQKGKGKEEKKNDNKPKPRGRAAAKPKGRKDRKTSKEKNNGESESEESEKEEKLNKEEELAMTKKAEEVTYDWASDLLKDYIPGIIENSAKMELFFYILNESIKLGDRLLLFSQSLFTLNLIEDFLERNFIPGTTQYWERNTSYYRLDGSTHALEREKLINEFNANPHVYLFLVSTRAGSLGINLVGANRVIVFDASWNPCHDTQAVCRVYRYGQKKPCFVYRFVMDCCLEKKIYDRQINKQGMADRVVDECNPDAVLSMKEITNLCFDNDEKEPEIKDLSEHKDKYIDMLMQGIITLHGKLLSKEPFQHESLLVDRKEKKLSSAEKRLAQRGYELEKKAASGPKPAAAYRTVRTADGSLVQRPVASVRPMQHGARWIPADVWRRQGMTAQEMTLPLDVVIPTNSAEKTNIVLKAGQRVMVLKSPKGIYMQLESGKIIAIKTSLKGLGQKGGDSKDNPVGKKVLGSRPTPVNIPGSLKNNSAITITSKTSPRPGYHRVIRPSFNKITRPALHGQKISDIRNRLGELRSYSAMRGKLPMSPTRMLRPNLPGSLSITKIPKDVKRPNNDNNAPNLSSTTDEPQVLDSDEDEERLKDSSQSPKETADEKSLDDSKSTNESDNNKSEEKESSSNEQTEPIVLTTDEKLPSEEALEHKSPENDSMDAPMNLQTKLSDDTPMNLVNRNSSKINLLKNYRHQRTMSRPQNESSLSQLERTATALNKEGLPDFRKNLDDITQSYSPGSEERSSSSRKKRSPNKVDVSDSQTEKQTNMSHSVSSMLGPSNTSKSRMGDPMQNSVPQVSQHSRLPSAGNLAGIPQDAHSLPYNLGTKHQPLPTNMGHGGLIPGSPAVNNEPPSRTGVESSIAMPSNTMPTSSQPYPASNPPSDGPYGQYPGYGMGYGAYPNAAYYGGYGSGYYPPYAPQPPPFTGTPPAPSEPYLPSNPQW